MSFQPNLDCLTWTVTYNDFGKIVPGVRTAARCAIVKLLAKAVKTTQRADSSASRGAAVELEEQSILLFPATTELPIDARVLVHGVTLRVTGREPRHDVNGRFDHWEVTLALEVPPA